MALVGSLSGSAGLIAVTGSFEPGTDNTYDSGTSTKKWKSVASTALTGSLTKLANGSDYLRAGTNVTLTTGSSGEVTITSIAVASTPGGNNYSVQFNQSNTFGGSTDLTWTYDTTKVLGVAGQVSASLGVTGSDVFVKSLTNGRVVLVGNGGKLVDDGGFTYTAGGGNVNVDLVGSISASVNVKGTDLYAASLNSGEVVVAGAAGILDGTSGLTFSGGTLGVVGNVSASLGVTGSDLFIKNLASGSVIYAIAGGKLSTDAGMTYDDGTDVLTVGGSTFGNNVTVAGDLTVNGTTTTINTNNLLVEDPIVVMGTGAVSLNSNGGIAIVSGSNLGGTPDLVFGRVANDTWGAGALNTNNGTVSSLESMTLVKMRASEFQVNGIVSVVKETGGVLIASGSTVALSGTNSIDFVRNGTLIAYVGTSPDSLTGIIPNADITYNLGSQQRRWANIYTGDLHLRNDRGDYTLIEEEDFLSIRFNKTGKRYKFVLEPVPELDEK